MTPILLSDDEVVATAVSAAVHWPVPLTTVRTDADELGAAALRGRRSLAIRDLVSSDGTTAEVVSEPVMTAASAATRWYGYTAARDSLAVPSGSATYAFLSDDTAVIDTVSGAGVHRFAASSSADAADLIVALAKNVFEYGFRGGSPGGVLVVGSTASPSWVLAGDGSLEAGAFGADGFALSAASDVWDPSLFQAVLVP